MERRLRDFDGYIHCRRTVDRKSEYYVIIITKIDWTWESSGLVTASWDPEETMAEEGTYWVGG